MCAIDVSPVVSTERLILRGPMVTDAAAIAAVAGDYNVAAMTTSMPHPYGLADAEAWIGKCRHLGRPFWNRGYATEAARAALKWAKRDWGRKVVVAGHFADNPASGQVLVKSGFLYTGDVEMRACTARGGALTPTRLMVWLA